MPSDARARRLGWLLLALALLLATWAMWPELADGGVFQRGWLGHNGARYAQIARNHERFGFAPGGAPLLECAPAAGQDVPWDGREPRVYGHHPPGVTWLLGALFLAGGVDETLARASAALATLLALVLLARLVGGVAGPAAGGAAALVAAAMPMTTVYGTHVEVQGPYVLCAFLAALLAWRRWTSGVGSAGTWVAACVLASAFDWFGLYAPAVCALDALLARPRRVGRALAAGALTLLLFGGWFLWLASLPGMSAGRVLGAAGVRGAGALVGEHAGLVGAFLEAWGRQAVALMPVLPLTLTCAVLAALPGLRRRRAAPASAPEKASDDRAVAAVALQRQLLLPPLLHAAIFPAGMLVHAYWLFALPPALAAGLLLVRGRLRPLGLATALCTVVLGAWSARAAFPPADPFPALLGQALAAHTAPGDVVLTNYGTNVLTPGAEGDVHTTMLPEVTFYADREVRGGVGTSGAPGVAVDLDEALLRRPDARWFVSVTPPGGSPSAALEARLASLADGPPLELSGAPPVRLWHLAR